MGLLDWKVQHQEALDAAESIIAVADQANRSLTPAEHGSPCASILCVCGRLLTKDRIGPQKR